MGTPRFNPGKPAEFKHQIVVRLRDAIVRQLDREAFLTGESRSELIEKAVVAMLQKKEST